MSIPEYLIGLICADQNSCDMITQLAVRAKNPLSEQLRTLCFKYFYPVYDGWTGDTLMVTDRHRYTLDKRFRLKIKPLYEFYRYLLCCDQLTYAYQARPEKKECLEKRRSVFLFLIRVLRYMKRKFYENK